MTQLDALKAFTEERDEDVLNTCLALAGSAIVNRCYPFDPGEPVRAVPPKYYNLQVEIAAYLCNKRGAEGQLAHTENGVTRTYESAGIPESMLRSVVPFAGTFGG